MEGINGSVDINTFNGTGKELCDLWNVSYPAESIDGVNNQVTEEPQTN